MNIYVSDEYVLDNYISSEFSSVVLTISESSILAIANAIWERSLPLVSGVGITYGDVLLSADDLNAISHAVWSRSL